MNSTVPQLKDLLNPTLEGIRALGGSGSNREIRNKVIELLALADEAINAPHGGKSQSRSELEYRLAWARTKLKGSGFVENSERGIWSLTPAGMHADRVDPDEVLKGARPSAGRVKDKPGATEVAEVVREVKTDEKWREDLLKVLQEMAPDAFERLCQRLFRESGFIEVEVTGRSGDGGIDGRGIIRLAGLISFPVVFQCKRYKTAVGPGVVRDFRGAMVGRSEKGVILTTGTFTSEAQKEATREGAFPIDLIDGELLAERIKATNLGVETRQVEREEVTLDPDFFRSI